MNITHTSTSAASAGFGTQIHMNAKDSSSIAIQGYITSEWVNATHATRTARVKLCAFDYADVAREAIRFEGDGTRTMLGFFGATAVAKPTALTAGLTSISASAPGTPDYAISDPTTSGYGFTTSDEFLTLMSVISNLQTRISQLETKLQSLGLIS